MIFRDERHEKLYAELCERMNNSDCYHKTVAYLIALDEVCRYHAEAIFDFEEGLIKPECLTKAWQTGTSRKTTRLTFNLWNGYCTDSDGFEDDFSAQYYSVNEIFCGSYAPYYWEAVKIRYPEYCSNPKPDAKLLTKAGVYEATKQILECEQK